MGLGQGSPSLTLLSMGAGGQLSELCGNTVLLGGNLGLRWEGSGGRGQRQSQNPPCFPDAPDRGHLPEAHQALQGHCHPQGLALPGKVGGER